MSSSSSSHEDEEYTGAPSDIDGSQMWNENLLPETYEKYNTAYNKFINWKREKNADTFSESVLLEYFGEIANSAKPTSMWAHYSMLKTTLKTKNCIDINQYIKLKEFLRQKSAGYVAKKAKTLEAEHVEKFINEAPDDIYLATKVALILGVTGGLKRTELTALTVSDITDHGNLFLVKTPHPRSKAPKHFVVTGKYYNIVKKYREMWTPKCTTQRFFYQFRNGKYVSSVIGKNKFGHMPREIAKFLNLEDANSYSGHSFRRTSAALLTNAGSKSSAVTKEDIDQSNNRQKYLRPRATSPSSAIEDEPQPKKPTNIKQPNEHIQSGDVFENTHEEISQDSTTNITNRSQSIVSPENNVILNLSDNSNCHITLNFV